MHQNQILNIAMEVAADFVLLVQTVARERVKDAKEVAKMDVRADAQVVVPNLAVVDVVVVAKEHV